MDDAKRLAPQISAAAFAQVSCDDTEREGRQCHYGGDSRQLNAELRERLRDAENLRREWGATGSPGRLNEVIEQLKRFADGRMEGDAQTAALLKANVVEPLRQLELELSRQLQQQAGRTNLRLRDEGAALFQRRFPDFTKRITSHPAAVALVRACGEHGERRRDRPAPCLVQR